MQSADQAIKPSIVSSSYEYEISSTLVQTRDGCYIDIDREKISQIRDSLLRQEQNRHPAIAFDSERITLYPPCVPTTYTSMPYPKNGLQVMTADECNGFKIPRAISPFKNVKISVQIEKAFPKGFKAWQAVIESSDLKQLRNDFFQPAKQFSFILFQREPVQTFEEYARKTKKETNILSILDRIPQQFVTRHVLHIAVEKKWTETAMRVMKNGLSPFFKTVQLAKEHHCCELSQNKSQKLRDLYKQAKVFYKNHQDSLENNNHFDRDEFPTNSFDTVDEAEALAIVEGTPTSHLSPDHMHAAAQNGFRQVVTYLHMEGIVAYKRTLSLISHCFVFEQAYERQKKISNNVVNEILALESENEVLQKLQSFRIDAASIKKLDEKATLRGWRKIIHYLYMQECRETTISLVRTQPLSIPRPLAASAPNISPYLKPNANSLGKITHEV
jgi:hypothetical protein